MKNSSRATNTSHADCAGKKANGKGLALRARMLAPMTEKGLSEATQAAYVRGVLGLVRHRNGRSPDCSKTA